MSSSSPTGKSDAPLVASGESVASDVVSRQEQETTNVSAWDTPWSAHEAAWDGQNVSSQTAGQDSSPPTEYIEGLVSASAPEENKPVRTKKTPPPRKSPGERQRTTVQNSEENQDTKPMTLMQHLGELRTRLVRSALVVGLAFVACYGVADILFAELCKPLVAALPEGSKLIFTALPEAFFVHLQVALVAAIFVASPYLFFQVWAFVSPGLYDEEKKFMLPIAAISALFFISGASFCFFVVFPYAFTFFVGFATEEIAAMPSLSEYLGFALKLLIAFGLIFEMPLFTFFLSRMGVVTASLMRGARRYAVLCIFIVAAILTPPDVISQLLMAMPMILLYEFSILVAVVFGRKKVEKKEDTDNAEDMKNKEHETKETM